MGTAPPKAIVSESVGVLTERRLIAQAEGIGPQDTTRSPMLNGSAPLIAVVVDVDVTPDR